MGNCSVIIMFYSAVDIRFYDWWSAFHDLAGIHTAFPGICCAPVHSGAPRIQFKQNLLLTSQVSLDILNLQFPEITQNE